jgi:regulatory protein
LSGSDPLAAALRLLAVRDRSAAELGERLRRQGFAEERITAALARCRELGYLDDARFARERARTLRRTGRAVGPRLLAELRRAGVSEADASVAAVEAGTERSEAQLLGELLARRFPGFCWAAAGDRERRRAVDYFLRRGFAPSLVLSHLQKERL